MENLEFKLGPHCRQHKHKLKQKTKQRKKVCDAGIDINTITSIRLGAQGLAEEKQIQKKILSSFVFVNLRGKVCFCYFAYAHATSED